jgi:HSP20 family protein
MPTETAAEPFAHLARSMGKMMERMGKDFSGFFPGETWTPNVNVYETDTAYVVCVEIAGVLKDQIDLTVNNHRLLIQGRRESPVCPAEVCEIAMASEDPKTVKPRVHVMEIDHGNFSREVELPDTVIEDNIIAAYRNGMLWIELPKRLA